MKTPSNSRHDHAFQLDEFYTEFRDDGNGIKFLDRKEIEKSPFPGLRPFKTSEFQLFNGRDGQAEELIKRLKANHFLAVIGSSGTGKSSLIRAGLVPQLLAGYFPGAGTRWDITICRPGKNPVENLAIALARTKCKSNNNDALVEDYELINPMVNRSHYGILDVNNLFNPPEKPAAEKSNFLIIVDQFEELFRFNRNDLGSADMETHFVNLLLKASLNTDSSIYIIITMRSEFLGDCVKYRGLPEAINNGQYLVPQLNRDQIREVIENPILLAGKKIAPGLLELLVNEIEESKTKKDLDQLPILQHALMRTYQKAMKRGAISEITYEDFKEAGGLEKALANHADEKFAELADGKTDELSFKQQIAKLVFQALTDASSDKKGGRRPTELKNIYGITSSLNATEQQVDEVVNQFRDTETSFIMPPINTDLFADLIMDISHESLMRQWKTLRDWVSEEAESAKYYLRLVDSVKQYSLIDADGKPKKREKELLSGTELQLALDWRDKYKPTSTWAGRYHNNFDECIAYLSASVDEQDRQSKIEIARKKKLQYLSNAIVAVSLIAVIVCVGLVISANNAKDRANEEKSKAEKNLLMINEGELDKLVNRAEIIMIAKGDPEEILKQMDSIYSIHVKPKTNEKQKWDSLMTSIKHRNDSISNHPDIIITSKINSK